VFFGLVLAICCGICWGLFLAPLRIMKAWEWENTWAIWSIVGMFLGPLLVAIATVPHYWAVNRALGSGVLSLTLLLGAFAGMSGFLYSMTVPAIGLGLATALNGGSSMAMSLLPLFFLHSRTVFHTSGLLTMGGVALAVIGIAFCGRGGELRERERAVGTREEGSKRKSRLSYGNSVVACCVAGIISSAMNVVLAFPNPIFDVAHKFGSSDFGAANAFLSPYLIGGFFSNVGYSVYLLRKNHTFSRYLVRGAFSCALWALFMSIVFVFGMSSYAGAVGLMGSFGAVIAWGVSMAAMILVSGVWDVALGEWNRKPLQSMVLGIGFLMTAIVALSFAEYFHYVETV
jgi:L-rhamnose-H+ transport protein